MPLIKFDFFRFFKRRSALLVCASACIQIFLFEISKLLLGVTFTKSNKKSGIKNLPSLSRLVGMISEKIDVEKLDSC